MDSFEQRLKHIEQKVQFIMQTLSLTRRTPDGQTDSRSLTELFQEMHNHDGNTPQTFADVAQRAFTPEGTGSQPPRPQSADGPDGFPGEDGNDTDTTT
jgi:hypothetical protein